MLRNPESGDIEGIIYSLNITKDKCRDRVFSIVTDREYDYEALLDPKYDTIHFLNLSSRLLPLIPKMVGESRIMPFPIAFLYQSTEKCGRYAQSHQSGTSLFQETVPVQVKWR